jgi:hypothetical protein
LAAINNTMTRVNGVFEEFFCKNGVIAKYDAVIYTNLLPIHILATAGAAGAWNQEYEPLTNTIGSAST